jgi:hypothetical protein
MHFRRNEHSSSEQDSSCRWKAGGEGGREGGVDDRG